MPRPPPPAPLLPGHVALVGAGPGDPNLLTLAAASLIGQADVVLHDLLAGRAALAFMRAGADAIGVGKSKARAAMRQPRINALLVDLARAGRRVVRLKGGDPFLFGRGAEEALALAAAGIPFRVVPGVSAGLAAPAAACIPVTHRGIASAVTFVTGHDETGALPDLDWGAIARGGQTVVAFMALTTLDALAVRLIAGGRDPAEPVCVISRASLPEQRTLHTTLGAATLAVRREAIDSPATVVIGRVVDVARTLAAPAVAAQARIAR
jgi:uroporphyrin-III C-methyltransferase